MSLDGQVALVTGGSRGIGRAIAEALAREGAAVGIAARGALEAQELPGRVLALPLDVTDRDAVERAVRELEAAFGPVTLLVNNAGGLEAIGPLWELDPDAWWRELEVHVRGTVLCIRAVLPGMIERDRGRIVNVVGMLGQRGHGHTSAYACAKAAMWRLTDNLGAELSGHGVQVFCISPGPVLTDVTRPFVESEHARRWVPVFGEMSPEDWYPAERGAQLVVKLARGDADALSGRYVHVDMDLDELTADAERIAADDRLVLRVRE